MYIDDCCFCKLFHNINSYKYYFFILEKATTTNYNFKTKSSIATTLNTKALYGPHFKQLQIRFFTFSYEIQEEGPVQQISYVSDKERGYLRIVSADDQVDYLRLVGERHCLSLNINHI